MEIIETSCHRAVNDTGSRFHGVKLSRVWLAIVINCLKVEMPFPDYRSFVACTLQKASDRWSAFGNKIRLVSPHN